MENVILKGLLPTGYDDVEDLVRVGSSNFLYAGLNIVYGLEGSGKSWQLPIALKSDTRDKIYLDTDGSNGKQFVKHCNEHNVSYVKSETISEYKDKTESIIENIIPLMKDIVKSYEELGKETPTIIIDSLSSIGEGQEINNAEKIAPILYALNNFAHKHNICLILIDHATRNESYEDFFKLEGNEGGKKRTSVTVNKYVSDDYNNPQNGGYFKCERARGNADGLRKGEIQTVMVVSADKAREWVLLRNPEWMNEDITKTVFSDATRNSKDKWVRDFIDDLFECYEVGSGRAKTKMLRYKKGE